jgi:hypothetical protein
VWGNYKNTKQDIEDILKENPKANASVLLDKLEPETVKINKDEVN